MRLLGASFKKTDEKPTANAYATELKRLNSGVERTIWLFMHGFRMIGFRRKEALFVLYPDFTLVLSPPVKAHPALQIYRSVNA